MCVLVLNFYSFCYFFCYNLLLILFLELFLYGNANSYLQWHLLPVYVALEISLPEYMTMSAFSPYRYQNGSKLNWPSLKPHGQDLQLCSQIQGEYYVNIGFEDGKTRMQNSWFLQQYCGRLKSSGMWPCLVGSVVPNIFKDHTTFIFMVRQSDLFLECLALNMETLWSFKMPRTSPKTQYHIPKDFNLQPQDW